MHLLSRAIRLFRGTPSAGSVNAVSCGPEDVVAAVQHGGKVDLKRLVAGGVNLNACERSGVTALMIAAERGYEDVVRALLARHADLGVRADAAVKFRGVHAESSGTGSSNPFFGLLSMRGMVPPPATSWTALTFAVSKGHEYVVRALLSRGAQPAAHDLMWAAAMGHNKILMRLLSHGVDVHVTDSRGFGALAYAAGHGRTDTVRALFAAHARHCFRPIEHFVEMESPSGVTPLLMAALGRHWETTKLLFDWGAKVRMDARMRIICGGVSAAGAEDVADFLWKHQYSLPEYDFLASKINLSKRDFDPAVAASLVAALIVELRSLLGEPPPLQATAAAGGEVVVLTSEWLRCAPLN